MQYWHTHIIQHGKSLVRNLDLLQLASPRLNSMGAITIKNCKTWQACKELMERKMKDIDGHG